ncbi:GLPGLI family protein [Pedobacter sp. Du54]|uniref:GLPGLI family protein n=1 Tax=Pedobacter anseongensis TaxID=3133439 RepID=UPI0030B63193
MKNTFIVFLFLLSTNTFAQKPDPVIARVHYTYISKSDTLKNGKARAENMILFIGKNTSLYASYDKIKHEISEEQKFWAMIASGGGKGKGVFIIDDTNSKWMTTTANLFYVKENKFFIREIIAYNAYLVEETAPKIDWKISKDTASFSGLACLKATANFEGKNWIAWFAPSVPFPGGPWKLNSLPGLIIEACDEQKEIQFQFGGLENAKLGDHVRDRDITKGPNASPNSYNAIDQAIGRDVGNAYFENIIRLPIGAIKVTKKELEKFKDALKKDPKGFNKAQSGN